VSAGTLSVQLFTPAVARARKLGIAVDDLLEAEGISEAMLADPDARIAFEANTRLWDGIAARAGTSDFGLAAAKDMPSGYFDLHEYLVRCSPTLGDGLRRAFRFLGLVSTRGLWQVEVAGKELRVINRPPGMISRHGHDFAIYMVLMMARRAVGRPIALTRLEMMVLEPADTAPLREAFGCPIEFGCAANVLVFPGDHELLALPARDDKLVALIERHATWMIAELGDDHASLSDRVRRTIFHLFQRDTMTIERVARTLGMSGRSLQRQLRDEQTSFRELVDEVRREIAVAHVTAGRTPITTIALLLDFSDASAFHRSFRRWTGQSPSEFRAAAKS
jgi:AraC-like DNA-binding protein